MFREQLFMLIHNKHLLKGCKCIFYQRSFRMPVTAPSLLCRNLCRRSEGMTVTFERASDVVKTYLFWEIRKKIASKNHSRDEVLSMTEEAFRSSAAECSRKNVQKNSVNDFSFLFLSHVEEWNLHSIFQCNVHFFYQFCLFLILVFRILNEIGVSSYRYFLIDLKFIKCLWNFLNVCMHLFQPQVKVLLGYIPN